GTSRRESGCVISSWPESSRLPTVDAGCFNHCDAGIEAPDASFTVVVLNRSRLASYLIRRPWKELHRSSEIKPTARPCGVRRRSALSTLSRRRYSAREVNIRYGSKH